MAETKGFWVIGDIHGMYDPLAKLIDEIYKSQGYLKFDKIIFIGDYIDHGPSSKQVIDLILQLKQMNEFEVITLAGNHEDLLLSFLYEIGSYKDYPNAWFYNGAVATLSSFFGLDREFVRYYGILDTLRQYRDDQAQEKIRKFIFEHLDKKYLDFFENLVYGHKEVIEIYGKQYKFAFLHAGYMPQEGYRYGDEVIITEDQIEDQLKPRKFREFTQYWQSKKIYVEYNNVWIRKWPRDKVGDYILIHGHDPVFRHIDSEAPKEKQLNPLIVKENYGFDGLIRINVDTGAVYGKSLTAVHIGKTESYYAMSYFYVEVSRGYRYYDNVTRKFDYIAV